MLVAFALNSPEAIRVVLALGVAVAACSISMLALFYPRLRRWIWGYQRIIIKSRVRLACFTASLVLLPLGVTLLGLTSLRG